jgi:hypothetical protein
MSRAVGTMVRGAVIVCALGAVLAGCGGGSRQDANEPKGLFPIKVVKATFPAKQRLADRTALVIEVQNSGSQTVPNIAVTILGKGPGEAHAFAEDNPQPGLADPSRPIWELDAGPRGGDTAYYNTWALGPLAPGAVRTFRWDVTAVASGRHTISYKVGAGLNGKARALGPGGAEPGGAFTVQIDGTPARSHVNPSNGKVVKAPPTIGAR